jgi:uncharacterized protein YicC (UPF0701 family)
LRRTRAQLGKLLATLDAQPRRLASPASKQVKEKLRNDIAQAKARLKKIHVQHHALPARVSVAQAQKGEVVIRLSKERKHLTNVLKMLAYQIESDLLELIRPHYKRVEDEGRTLIHTFLQDAADIEPTADELRIQFAALSSQHRTRVLEALCATLNGTNRVFPGTELKMRYSVATAS